MECSKSDNWQKLRVDAAKAEAKMIADLLREYYQKGKTDMFGRPINEPIDIMKKKQFKK